MSVIMELSVMFEVELLYKKQHNQICFFQGFIDLFIYSFNLFLCQPKFPNFPADFNSRGDCSAAGSVDVCWGTATFWASS